MKIHHVGKNVAVPWLSNLRCFAAAKLEPVVQLVPAVTELIIAELLYLQYKDRNKPMYLYINSTGTTRADGEVVCRRESNHKLPTVPNVVYQTCRLKARRGCARLLLDCYRSPILLR